MKVYHGSTMNVKKPIVTRGRNKTDFGKGFYTTTNIEQARDWAVICQQKMGSGVKAIVSTYEIDDNLLDKNEYDILKFSAPVGEAAPDVVCQGQPDGIGIVDFHKPALRFCVF